MPVQTGDEVQAVTVTDATDGTFTLTFDEEETAAIDYDAAAAAVKSALVALDNLTTTDVDVTGGTGPWTVTFQGDYTDTDVPELVADGTELIGEGATVEVETDTAGNPAALEFVYVDISVEGGLVGNLEVRPGERPPPGLAVVSKHDYYNP